MKRWIICTSLVFIYTFCFTQNASIKQFSRADGLKMTEVTEALMTQDSLWWIWEGDRTISKFNRYSFKNFEPNFNPYLLYEKVFGKDFTLIRASGEILYYQNEEFKLIRSHLGRLYEIKGDIFASRNDSIFIFSQKDLSFNYRTNLNTIKKGCPCIETHNIEKYYYFDDHVDYYRTKEKLIKVDKENKRCIEIGVENKLGFKTATAAFLKMQQILLSKAKDTISIKTNQISKDQRELIKITPNTIRRMEVSFYKQSSSLESFTDQTTLKPSHEGLEIFNPNIKFFSKEDPEMAKALHTIAEDNKGNIWFGDYKGGWSKWNNNTLKKVSNDFRVLPGALQIDDRIYFTFEPDKDQTFGYIQNDEIKIIKEGPQPVSGYLIRTFPNEEVVLLSNRNGALIYDKKDFPNSPYKRLNLETGLRFKYPLCVDQDLAGRYWFSKNGLAVYNSESDELKDWIKSDSLDNYVGSMSIACDTLGTLWCGSTHGLYHIRDIHKVKMDSENVFDNAKILPLPNSTDHKIFGLSQIDSFLIIGGISHISFLSLPSFYRNPENPIIYQYIFGEDIQGSGAEQNCFLLDSKNRLWVGCQEGALMFDWEHLKFDQTKNRIQLEHIKIGNDQIDNQNVTQITIPTDNRNLEVYFGPKKNPSLLKNIFFEYAFINDSNDTISFKSRDQEGIYKIDYIPPDKYLLNIKARKHGQIMDEVNISVTAPYSLFENPLFWVLSALLAAFLVIMFFLIQAKNKERIHQKDLKLALANESLKNTRLQAIIASFNPHFINNSLHWAQSRYSRDTVLTTLIGRLSENIQYIFQQTRKGEALHKLKDELRIVDNYIAIQNIRFGDDFIYHPPELLEEWEDYLVPIMQIQIHVENAIEHGISNREESSYVKVVLNEDKTHLVISIEDDGSGRVKAKSVGSKGTQSGTQMLLEVHEIINSKNDLKITTKYDDDYLGDFGTRVIIRIPKQLK